MTREDITIDKIIKVTQNNSRKLNIEFYSKEACYDDIFCIIYDDKPRYFIVKEISVTSDSIYKQIKAEEHGYYNSLTKFDISDLILRDITRVTNKEVTHKLNKESTYI